MSVSTIQNYSDTDFKLRFPEYGNTKIIDELRSTEYARLDKTKQVYLDYTGGSLYAQSQLDWHFELLKNDVFGNPHSTNPTSFLATQFAEDSRKKILSYFNATENYICVFTQNATQSLGIIGDCFPFQDNGQFLLTVDNHNSVNGIREFCKNKGANFDYVKLNVEDLSINTHDLDSKLNSFTDKKHKLFAFPAQSNVSGAKHPLNYIEKAQNKGWSVLLDAAAYVPSSRLDLTEHQPDFVSLSFYKMFGYPTGLGCLLIHKKSFHLLDKKWFSGGNVSMVSVVADGFFLQNNHEKFENGTINYLGIPAIKFGLEWIEKIGINNIQTRVKCLTNFTLEEFSKLKHSNGLPLIKIAGPGKSDLRGGTIIFNVFDQNNKIYPIKEIELFANSHNISLRTGCFCNPGIDELNCAIGSDGISDFFSKYTTGNNCDVMEFLGINRGNIRISFGLVSNFNDTKALLDMLSGLLDKDCQNIVC